MLVATTFRTPKGQYLSITITSGSRKVGLGILKQDVAKMFLDTYYQGLNLSAKGSFECELYSGALFTNPLFNGPITTSAVRYSVTESVMNNLAICMTNAYVFSHSICH